MKKISPTLASILLMLIAVAAGVMAWVWLGGFMAKLKPSLRVEGLVKNYAVLNKVLNVCVDTHANNETYVVKVFWGKDLVYERCVYGSTCFPIKVDMPGAWRIVLYHNNMSIDSVGFIVCENDIQLKVKLEQWNQIEFNRMIAITGIVISSISLVVSIISLIVSRRKG